MRLAALIALCALPAAAQTDFKALSERERLLLGDAVRAVLLAHPEVVANALAPSPYQDAIEGDLALIEQHKATLFGEADMALIVGANCEACAPAQEELATLAARFGLTVNTLMLEENPALAEAFEIDSLPFYVLPDKLLRGAMPTVVLERYLTKLAP